MQLDEWVAGQDFGISRKGGIMDSAISSDAPPDGRDAPAGDTRCTTVGCVLLCLA